MSSATVKSPALKRRRRLRWQRVLAYALIVLLLFIAIFPCYWLLQMSFKTGVEAFKIPPSFIFVPTLRNYADLLDTKFPLQLRNSAVVATTTTVLALVLGVPAAYALSRARFRHDRLLSLWILFSRMLPPMGLAIPFFIIYRDLKWTDTLQGLVVVYLTFSLALVIWTMRTFFDGIPRSLEEAAFIDGAGPLRTFLTVTVPLCGPGLAATAILCFLLAWNDFFFALILTRTQAMTAPVGIINFLNYEGWEWGKISAGGTVVMLPVVIFSLVVRQYLVQGLMTGAVKG
ncbi:MAG: carbohydrate ABC transporter permease [Dehalococcoidales bacterium]|nr:carbohydrate ABC transporter permease [Dehalococcoidales bacterium]